MLVLRSDEVGHPRFARVVGVLSRGPVELVDGVEVVRVELEPARVSLHRDEQDGSGTEVPLEAYLAAECPHPDFATAARQVLAHANDAHAADLRESIARATHLSTDDVVAAEITSLTATGAEVSWIDERGAHRTRIAFPSEVTCPYGLAESLRQALDGLGRHA